MKINSVSLVRPIHFDQDSVVQAVSSDVSKGPAGQGSGEESGSRRLQLAGLIASELPPVQDEVETKSSAPSLRLAGSELAQYLLVESSYSSAGKVVRRLNRKYAEERKKQALNKYQQLKTQALHDQVLAALESPPSPEAGEDDFGSLFDTTSFDTPTSDPATSNFDESIESSSDLPGDSLDEALQNQNQGFVMNRVA